LAPANDSDSNIYEAVDTHTPVITAYGTEHDKNAQSRNMYNQYKAKQALENNEAKMIKYLADYKQYETDRKVDAKFKLAD